MHSKGKGMSASALPYRRSQPSWSKATPEEVCDQIFKLARRGLSPSQIGVILRDSHGVPQVKGVTGNKVLRILKTNGELRGEARGVRGGPDDERAVRPGGVRAGGRRSRHGGESDDRGQRETRSGAWLGWAD
jgi:hypothetical protein